MTTGFTRLSFNVQVSVVFLGQWLEQKHIGTTFLDVHLDRQKGEGFQGATSTLETCVVGYRERRRARSPTRLCLAKMRNMRLLCPLNPLYLSTLLSMVSHTSTIVGLIRFLMGSQSNKGELSNLFFIEGCQCPVKSHNSLAFVHSLLKKQQMDSSDPLLA